MKTGHGMARDFAFYQWTFKRTGIAIIYVDDNTIECPPVKT